MLLRTLISTNISEKLFYTFFVWKINTCAWINSSMSWRPVTSGAPSHTTKSALSPSNCSTIWLAVSYFVMSPNVDTEKFLKTFIFKWMQFSPFKIYLEFEWRRLEGPFFEDQQPLFLHCYFFHRSCLCTILYSILETKIQEPFFIKN